MTLTLQTFQEMLPAIKRSFSSYFRELRLLLRERVRPLLVLSPSAGEQLVHSKELPICWFYGISARVLHTLPETLTGILAPRLRRRLWNISRVQAADGAHGVQ